jgi:hypothetical protein
MVGFKAAVEVGETVAMPDVVLAALEGLGLAEEEVVDEAGGAEGSARFSRGREKEESLGRSKVSIEG